MAIRERRIQKQRKPTGNTAPALCFHVTSTWDVYQGKINIIIFFKIDFQGGTSHKKTESEVDDTLGNQYGIL